MTPVRRCLSTQTAFLLLCLALGSLPPSVLPQANVKGQWQTLPNLIPINPIHVALISNGKVLVVSGSGNVDNNPNFRAGVYDPRTRTTTTQAVTWDMFCDGMIVLPDGRAFINGGIPWHTTPTSVVSCALRSTIWGRDNSPISRVWPMG